MSRSNEAVYALPPIDWWDGWTPLDDAIAHGARDDSDGYQPALLVELVARAALLFSSIGWEGDGRWRVTALPVMNDGAQEISFLIAVKQENNGSTFVLSPERLPWLDEYRAR